MKPYLPLALLTLGALLLLPGCFYARDAGGPGGAAPLPGESALPSPTDTAPSKSPAPTDAAPAESPPPEPSPSPAPTEEELLSARAEAILADMTLHEKLCQLLVVYPESLTGEGAVTAAGDAMADALARWPVAGFLLDRDNMVSKDQLTDLTADLQSMSALPLLLTCDEEGGRVTRLMAAVGTTWVGPMLRYKDDGPDTARANARTIGSDLVSCGLNMDLAPVADVWSNPDNSVIGDRAYSDDFDQAALLVAAAVEGFHDGGVACTLKHFPGHGDTAADSHDGAVYVERTLDELRGREFLPFRSGMAAGADAVMVGHITVPAADGLPALLSRTLVTEVLRGELGFDGVVITDSLEMGAVTQHYTPGELAVGAIEAGVDVLLCPVDLAGTVEALADAVASGRLTEARIDESVARVLTLKLERGMIQ